MPIETHVTRCHYNFFKIFLSFRKASVFITGFLFVCFACTENEVVRSLLRRADVGSWGNPYLPSPGPSPRGTVDFGRLHHASDACFSSSAWVTEQALLNVFEAGLLTHSGTKIVLRETDTSSFSCCGSPHCFLNSVSYL